jgi:hypothetical protein
MVDAREMTCQELVELVTEYFERTLPTYEVSRFEAHLETCRGCRTYLEQMRQTIEALGRLTEDEVPQEAREALLHVFRTWKNGRDA